MVNLTAPRTLRASAAAQGLRLGGATNWEPFSNLEQQCRTVLAGFDW